jgi:predicted RNA-binding Zn-ribbon protein involved in translation (DUF1610 family)
MILQLENSDYVCKMKYFYEIKFLTLKQKSMETIPMCPNCGNTHKGDRAKKCTQCKKITCSKCSFSGCSCGSQSITKLYVIGSK